MSEGCKICRKNFPRMSKLGEPLFGGSQEKNMSEGGKKSCFVSEGVRKIPVFVQGVEKIPILSEGVTENFLPPPVFLME